MTLTFKVHFVLVIMMILQFSFFNLLTFKLRALVIGHNRLLLHYQMALISAKFVY